VQSGTDRPGRGGCRWASGVFEAELSCTTICWAEERGRASTGAGRSCRGSSCTGCRWWPGISRAAQPDYSAERGWQRVTGVRQGILVLVLFGHIASVILGPILVDPQPFFRRWPTELSLSRTQSRSPHRQPDFYWLADLHFVRINGLGFPCRAACRCDADRRRRVWAFVGLTARAMFLTGSRAVVEPRGREGRYSTCAASATRPKAPSLETTAGD